MRPGLGGAERKLRGPDHRRLGMTPAPKTSPHGGGRGRPGEGGAVGETQGAGLLVREGQRVSTEHHMCPIYPGSTQSARHVHRERGQEAGRHPHHPGTTLEAPCGSSEAGHQGLRHREHQTHHFPRFSEEICFLRRWLQFFSQFY